MRVEFGVYFRVHYFVRSDPPSTLTLPSREIHGSNNDWGFKVTAVPLYPESASGGASGGSSVAAAGSAKFAFDLTALDVAVEKDINPFPIYIGNVS